MAEDHLPGRCAQHTHRRRRNHRKNEERFQLYRIDVVALGTNVCVINAAGRLQWVDGTSFSTPTLAGLCACLWQSLSWLKNKELIDLIRQTASRSKHPDAELGYGVPDMYKAYRKEMNELL